MPALFDLLYREYCRACLAEMLRKQLLLPAKKTPLAGSVAKRGWGVGRVCGRPAKRLRRGTEARACGIIRTSRQAGRRPFRRELPSPL
jgi:hypothetical protein